MSDDITRNYHGGNPQSEKANKRTRKTRDRATLVVFLHMCGLHGATCDEAEIATGLSHQTCSARFSDLKKDNVIIEIGETRLTRSGSPAAVCVLTRFTQPTTVLELPLV